MGHRHVVHNLAVHENAAKIAKIRKERKRDISTDREFETVVDIVYSSDSMKMYLAITPQ